MPDDWSWWTKAKRAASELDDETWNQGGVSPTLNVMDNTGESRATVLIPINADALRGEGAAATPSPDAEGRVRLRDPGLGIGNEGDPAGTLAAAGPGAVAVLGNTTHALTAEGHDASEDGTGRGTPVISVSNDSAPQVYQDAVGALKIGSGLDIPSAPAVSGGSTSQVRRLTPRECERLQGFPDDWTDGQADSARYRQMGNAVAVPVVEWIMRRLVEVDADA
jgi:DNA (cytosine-5)-methyltransferase 1